MKHGRGPVPLAYKRLFLEKAGTTPSLLTTLILTGLYRAYAGTLRALGELVACFVLAQLA
ncbi:MAG: hypothetical protein V2I76_06010 [Roseobacter sp.]|jgi:hypothetical protein|nr:hypothetical protein [Roseobacter sp.]